MVRCSPLVWAEELDLDRDPDPTHALDISQASPGAISHGSR
ncbi:hypothetical protein [Vulcanococcus limneticus]